MPEDDPPPEFERLLEYLEQSRGFDFTAYKRASLRRRIDKRMRSIGMDRYEDYLEHLEFHPHEFRILFNAILINVTGFFRDGEVWDRLQAAVLPELLGRLGPDAPIRVWSAGCSSGEEAYTTAMVLAEILGADEFVRRVKIYGTDVDDHALQAARHGSYTERDIEGVPEALRDVYFERTDDRWVFRADLRRSVIFGRLDVLRDAPISRLALLICRNTLMYFNAEAQAQVISRFHFALDDEAVLVLGRAETLLSHSAQFEPIERKHRIFRRVGADGTAERDHERTWMRGSTVPATDLAEGLPMAAFDALPVAALLFDERVALLEVNERARRLLRLTGQERGTVLQDLDVSYRPADLRTPVDQAFEQRRATVVSNVELGVDGVARNVDIEVMPLFEGSQPRAVAMFFHDRTEQRELEERLQLSTIKLEQAYLEVQSTNEELETTNEELQSTVEELETTNEELQSTNEELETMNEELQSTNDELHAVNEEVRSRGDELEQLNQFMAGILASFHGGVVVVDDEQRVLVWNAQAADLWGLREEEVRGQTLPSIDIGLPIAELQPAVRQTIGGQSTLEELEVEAITRRGRTVRCHVSVTPLHLDGRTPTGAILVMECTPD